MDVQVRFANIDQAPSIANVLRLAFQGYKPLYTLKAYEATTPTAEQIKKRWDDGPVWVAGQNIDIVGTVAAVPKDESLYIRSMAVLPSARGRMIGKLLLDHVEAYATDKSFQRLYLSTTPFLNRAIKLYERYGFARTDVPPHDLFGTPLLTMEKILRNKNE